jgi:GNAT superfamily N-acetyltransferase
MMKLIQVENQKQADLFLELPYQIYKNDPNWIAPLENEVADIFNPEKNKAFRNGKLKRWILCDDKKTIGRIAAFVNPKYRSKGDEFPVGGVGFFECVNDQDAADMLFDVAKTWLIEAGVKAMDGPINFGERDKWWGLLVDGFHAPSYSLSYNPPYYKSLFEHYGFQLFFEQYCFGMNVKKPVQQKIIDRHKLISQDSAFSVKNLEKKDILKYADDFASVYNQAWAGHGGMKELPKEQARLLFKKMKPVMDERLIWYAYHNEKPIAIFTNLPDLNQWFKYLNGKFGIWQKLKFLWIKTFTTNRKFTGLVFGIIPEFQGQGIDAYLIAEASQSLRSDSMPYEDYEMQWIGDFNPKMVNIAENLGDVTKSRTLITYRYNFNRDIPFKRHPQL